MTSHRERQLEAAKILVTFLDEATGRQKMVAVHLALTVSANHRFWPSQCNLFFVGFGGL